MVVLTAWPWPTNGHLIADVATLGYLDGRCLDVTYGEGTFWKQWRPKELVTCDRWSSASVRADFCELPFIDGEFDVVIFDPPYKMTGRPDSDVDERYGINEYVDWRERIRLMEVGLAECLRVARKYVLAKMQDQVVSGRKVWQTDILTAVATSHGWVKEDRFDLLRKPRTQPPGRRQVHGQSNYSTLLIFRRP